MKTIHSIAELKTLRKAWPGPVGFVPTMGALHAGHLTLVERAKANCQTVVTSIFVNPTQFNNPQDLEKYPRDLARDLRLLEAAGVNAVFIPQESEIYADGFRFRVEEDRDSQVLCGPKRPGHFAGVLTVVLKLFQLVRPDSAYFGEKDFQQLQLIRDMVNAFFLDIEIVPVPTVREFDGLAMSSRNLRLSAEERMIAPILFQALTQSKSLQEAKTRIESAGLRVDYLEEHWERRFAAAYLGEVRLIDNVQL